MVKFKVNSLGGLSLTFFVHYAAVLLQMLSMASSAVLKLADVNKSYESGSETAKVDVLKNVSFEVKAGESIAIIGPSGSGKSTLLNIIGTLDHVSSGRVLFDGDDLSTFDDEKLAEVRNRKIGFVFQAHHLLPQCTLLENVLIPTLAGDKHLRAGAEERGRKLLQRVGLEARINHRPGQLSGGERQRVAVVRALINQPRILLADEPTGALDQDSAQKLGDLLVELNREQSLTLVVVTHSLELAGRMQRQFELRGGKLTERK